MKQVGSGTLNSQNNPINLNKVKVTQPKITQLESGQNGILIQTDPTALTPAAALNDYKIDNLPTTYVIRGLSGQKFQAKNILLFNST